MDLSKELRQLATRVASFSDGSFTLNAIFSNFPEVSLDFFVMPPEVEQLPADKMEEFFLTRIRPKFQGFFVEVETHAQWARVSKHDIEQLHWSLNDGRLTFEAKGSMTFSAGVVEEKAKDAVRLAARKENFKVRILPDEAH